MLPRDKKSAAMNAIRRFCLFCGICMGIVTIFLLTCGRNAPARSLELVKFTPFMESGVFRALPAFSVSFRQPENKQRHRSASDGPEPGSPARVAARLVFPSRVLARVAFPRTKEHIPGPREIRGMLPFPFAPPVSLS